MTENYFSLSDEQRLRPIFDDFYQIYETLKKENLFKRFDVIENKFPSLIQNADYLTIERLQKEKQVYQDLRKKIEDCPEEEFEKLQKEYLRRKRIVKKQNLVLPQRGKHISTLGQELGELLKNEKCIFMRYGLNEVVEIQTTRNKVNEKEYLGFQIIKPNRFITLIEDYVNPVIEVPDRYGNINYIKKSINGDLARTLLESPQFQKEIPIIERIFQIPMPILHEGKLTFPKEGYDERFRSWLSPNSVKIDSKMDLKEAKNIILEIYKEFCFEKEQYKTNAIAGLLTPFLRGLFSNFNVRTPVFFYIANRERAGKDYCSGITRIVYLGVVLEESPISTGGKEGSNNEELRKKLTSGLIVGKKILHFPNNRGYLNNAVLESFVTSENWSDRLLGKNESLNLPNEIDISLSGNVGISYTPDFANRCRFVKLFLDVEDANSRKFENPDLHGWVLNNREKIISSLYTLIRNWVERGMPEGSLNFSSFPEWAKICGGILESAGIGSPCVPDTESLEIGGDTETAEMKSLFEICYNKVPNQWINRQKILNLISNEDSDLFSYLDFTKNSDLTKFGMKLNKISGRIFSNIRMIIKDTSVKGARREYKFISNDVTPVTPVTPSPMSAIENQKNIIYREKGIKGYKGNNLEEKPCENCNKLTSNQINSVFICEKCTEQVSEDFK